MLAYFSGVSSFEEIAMLKAAGIQHILVDQFDLKDHVADWNNLALDCGSYKLRDKSRDLSIPDYLLVAESRQFDFVIAPDNVKSLIHSHNLYLETKGLYTGESPLVPVWQWGSSVKLIESYLNEGAELVAIGGLVWRMKGKDEQMLKSLIRICKAFPQRIHVLGCNWLKAIKEIDPYAYSFDSSKWIDGGRYYHAAFIHERYGYLGATKQSRLGLNLTREELMIRYAKTIESFCNKTDPFFTGEKQDEH